MRYSFECQVCGRQFDELQGMNDEHIAFHCGRRAKRVWLSFYTDKDLMYQFDTTIFGPGQKGEAVNIHSRRQYKGLLKQHGLADATVRDCLSVKPKSDAEHKTRIRQLAKKMEKKIYEQGAMPWVKGRVDPKGTDKIREGKKCPMTTTSLNM